MKIDLHIHTSTGSDGALTVEEVVAEAARRHIDMMAITDHDSLVAQEKAAASAKEHSITYICGIELNVTLQLKSGKTVSLDFLGYGMDIDNPALNNKLQVMREHREWRALEIMKKVNAEFAKEGLRKFTAQDMENIFAGVDGAFGRPHIAAYMLNLGIVQSVKEAFDKYLVKCDVPKYPLSLPEASELIRQAGGVLILAHPNDPNGTSLITVSTDFTGQGGFISENMLEYINGVECWHSRLSNEATRYYFEFAGQHRLLTTGGSDCHQKPVIMGSVDVPGFVAEQFRH